MTNNQTTTAGPPPLTLESLPAELLYDIHLLSLSSTLPLVSRHLYSIFSHSSPHHKARFLAHSHPRSTLQHATRYPVCSLTVIHALERIKTLWDNRPGHKLRCPELPRRLLKGLGATHPATQAPSTLVPPSREDQWDSTRLPVITYLLEKYDASPNTRNGYFLARAVLAQHIPFIQLLLKHDADPSLNDGYAVTVAIGTGDLALVKMLIEREPDPRPTDEAEVQADLNLDGTRRKQKKRGRESDGGGGGKRRKVQERCKATSKMLEVAMKEENWEIVTYLQSKGAVPSLEALSYL